MAAVAYDGRLVLAYAGSCCWVRVFFDVMTDAQSVDYLGRRLATPNDSASFRCIVSPRQTVGRAAFCGVESRGRSGGICRSFCL